MLLLTLLMPLVNLLDLLIEVRPTKFLNLPRLTMENSETTSIIVMLGQKMGLLFIQLQPLVIIETFISL